MASYQQPSNSFRSHVDKKWTAACKHTQRHTRQSAKMMPVKRKKERKKERKSKKELKIREEEGELENMTVEKRFSAKLLYILFS